MSVHPATRPIWCSAGPVRVSIGDRFREIGYGTEWEVVSWGDQRVYSPSGIGGTQTIWCRPLTAPNGFWAQDLTPEGIAEWCGDSVAAALNFARSHPSSAAPKPGAANGMTP